MAALILLQITVGNVPDELPKRTAPDLLATGARLGKQLAEVHQGFAWVPDSFLHAALLHERPRDALHAHDGVVDVQRTHLRIVDGRYEFVMRRRHAPVAATGTRCWSTQ